MKMKFNKFMPTFPPSSSRRGVTNINVATYSPTARKPPADQSKISGNYVIRKWKRNTMDHSNIFATLGLSWNLSLAEDLESLSLQDGPQSGIILSLDPPTHPTASVYELEYLSKNWSDLPQIKDFRISKKNEIEIGLQ